MAMLQAAARLSEDLKSGQRKDNAGSRNKLGRIPSISEPGQRQPYINVIKKNR